MKMKNKDCNRSYMPQGMVPFIVYGYPAQGQMMGMMYENPELPDLPEIPSIPQQMAYGTPGAIPGMSSLPYGCPYGGPGLGMGRGMGMGRGRFGMTAMEPAEINNEKMGAAPTDLEEND